MIKYSFKQGCFKQPCLKRTKKGMAFVEPCLFYVLFHCSFSVIQLFLAYYSTVLCVFIPLFLASYSTKTFTLCTPSAISSDTTYSPLGREMRSVAPFAVAR